MYFNEGDTKPALRLSIDSIGHLLKLLPREKDHDWSHEVEVVLIVYWLACEASYRQSVEVFDITLSTVCRVVHKILNKMMSIIHQVIHFPTGEEIKGIGAGFARLAGHNAFKHAAGAIDDCHVRRFCHVRIIPPGEPQKGSYVNRKLSPSIILQVSGAFLDVYIGNPSSVHNASVLRSLMYRESYPSAGLGPLVVGACCILHNICLSADDLVEDDTEADGGGEERAEPEPLETTASRLRAQLVPQISAPAQLHERA
ncbi:hypothetical protein WMY93_011259 [Mugilogobius chulae]|uniref:DDE Tnp4 domain-containing protein n=1 Tax=Mugilogobius chulae TaxID=88201 RepID=A0AAW0P848_9GOBI